MSDGLLVESVVAGARADHAGIMPGALLVAVNGRPVRDVLEYYFRQAAPIVVLDLLEGGARRRVRLRKEVDEDLGLGLAPTPDLKCKEQCVFCFVHQNPKGLRKSLYFKDDDYRLSFLHGNFVTLTHAPEGALERIIEQRLSPLYVSVHATDPVLRGTLLGNRGPAPILPFLDRLRDGGITFYGQIVVCPGMNDGTVMEETLEALAGYHPACPSVAVVPLGLTEHRAKLPSLRAFGPSDAEACLARLAPLQRRFRREHGTSFAFAADEIYLRAGCEPPKARHYEGFALTEDGVGMWRRFHDAMRRRLRSPRKAGVVRRVALVTGELFAPTLQSFAASIAASTGHAVTVVPTENRLFGRSITVAGLLSGACLVETLSRAPDFDVALVPGEMLSSGSGAYRPHGPSSSEEGTELVTLDDMTLATVGSAVARPVLSGGRSAGDLLAALASLDGSRPPSFPPRRPS